MGNHIMLIVELPNFPWNPEGAVHCSGGTQHENSGRQSNITAIIKLVV